jgi:diacylglycerol kinase family enzyme
MLSSLADLRSVIYLRLHMGSKIPLPINGQPQAGNREGVKRRTVGVITNPNARQSVSAEVAGSHHVLREEVTRSPADVPAAIDRLLAHDPEAIIVNGGDGTLGSVIGHLYKTRPKEPMPRLVPVLGGTNNSVAKDVGAVGRIEAVKKRIAAHGSLAELPVVRRATMVVSSGDERIGCGFVFATGIVARFADAYYAGTMRGPVQAAKVVIEKMSTALLPTRANRAFWAFEPNHVTVNGRVLSLPKGAALTYCSTIDTQILFFRPFLASAKELVEQGRFNVLVNALPKTAIVRHFFSLVLGKYNKDGHVLAVGERFALDGTKRMMLDGEMRDVRLDEALTLAPGPVVEFVQL